MAHIRKTEKQIIEKEVVVEDYYRCDYCNERIEEKMYDAFKCTFEHMTGRRYPEGGSGQRLKLHFCRDCSSTIVGLLESVGAGTNIDYKHWDY